MFGREYLTVYTSRELYNKSTKEFEIGEAFLKEEADYVMDKMEERIKKLERENSQLKQELEDTDHLLAHH